MNDPTENIILRTESLSIGYRTNRSITTIADKIDITLEKGQLVGLVGANGIGKSTLMRTLTNVQSALSGNVLLNNRAIKNYEPLNLAKKISLVLTEQIVSKNLKVSELIALGRQPYTNWVGQLSDTDLEEVNKAIEDVNLSDIKNKYCYELSDGQLQQVMIARALAQQTELIFLDEPTTHLDLYNKVHILKLLKQLVSTTDKTILFSSHEIDLCIQICDKLIVMDKNNVYFDTPCNLISKGVFNSLFPSEMISFDQESGSFKVNK